MEQQFLERRQILDTRKFAEKKIAEIGQNSDNLPFFKFHNEYIYIKIAAPYQQHESKFRSYV